MELSYRSIFRVSAPSCPRSIAPNSRCSGRSHQSQVILTEIQSDDKANKGIPASNTFIVTAIVQIPSPTSNKTTGASPNQTKTIERALIAIPTTPANPRLTLSVAADLTVGEVVEVDALPAAVETDDPADPEPDELVLLKATSVPFQQ